MATGSSHDDVSSQERWLSEFGKFPNSCCGLCSRAWLAWIAYYGRLQPEWPAIQGVDTAITDRLIILQDHSCADFQLSR